MAKLGINTGSAPDAGDGDSLQQGAIKINSNFDEVYTLLGNGTALAPGIVTSIVGGNNIAVSTSVGQVTLDVTGNTWDDNTTGINTLSNVGIGTTNATDELKVSGTVKTDQIVVVGVSTFLNDVNFNFDLTIGEDASLERNLKVTGVSTFVGESNFNDSVLIAGITTCSNDLDVSNDIIVGGGVSVSGLSTFTDGINIGSLSQGIVPSGSNDVTFQNTTAGGTIKLRAAGDVEIQSYQGSTLLKTNTQAVTTGGLSLYYATGLTTEVERLKTTNTGVTVTGALNATSFVGDGSGLTGINATGTGVSISDGGSFIGVASAINFGSNLSVSPISAGIVTVTGQAGGGSTADVRTNTLNVSGMTTLAIGNYGSGSEVRFYSEESSGGSLSISHAAGNPYGVYMRFMSHDGDDATIETDSNANMTIDAGANIHLKVNGDSVLSGTENSGTTLYYGGAQKLATSSSGITVTGAVNATGGLTVDGAGDTVGKLAITDEGSYSQIQFYDNSGNSKVSLKGVADHLYIEGGGGFIRLHTYGLFYSDGDVVLNSGGNGGTDIGGTLNVSGVSTFQGNITCGAGVTVTGTAFSNQLNVSGVSTFAGYTTFGNHVSLGNNDEIRFGSSNQMKMYYSSAGDVGAFVESHYNDLHLVGSTSGGVRIITYNQDSLVANRMGSVDLYHNGSKKFETTGAGVTITGVCTATSFVGDVSTATAGKWTLGANGTSDYTFTGIGFTQTTNDPVLYLARGRVYEFVNGMGAHPFEIRVSAGGAAYNAGVTNNGASNGTIKFEIPMDAPNTLYYQCTSHAGMGNTISVYPNTI